MFSIDCVTLSDFADYEELLAALEVAGMTASGERPNSQPSFQFDYREVGLETVEKILGYANIAATNTPLGVSGLFEPIANEGEWVVFPLSGLERHLEVIAPDALHAFNEHGSLDRALSKHVDLTPGAQVALAVLQCIHFCKNNQLILAFSW